MRFFFELGGEEVSERSVSLAPVRALWAESKALRGGAADRGGDQRSDDPQPDARLWRSY